MSASYINLSLKSFTPPIDAGWYNLTTNRKILKQKKDFIHLTSPRVAGTKSVLLEFFKLNNLPIPSELKDNNDNNNNNNTKMSPNIDWKDITDIEHLSEECLESLNMFSFERICCKGRISKVVDGDTVDVFIMVPLKQLSEKCLSRCGGSISEKCNILYNNSDNENKMVVKLRCRLFGIDTADEDKKKKDAGTQYLTSLLNECNNVVYCKFLGKELHGRELAELYIDSGYQNSICKQMLSYDDPIYGKLAYPYFGGTKIKH